MSGRKAKGKAAPSPSAAASPPAATKETVEAGQSGRKGVTAAAEAASSKETERVHDHAAEDSDGGDRGYGYEHTDDEDEDDSPGAAAAREARYPMMTESEAREALARQQRLEAQLQATMAQMAALERLAVQAGRADLLTGPGLRRRGAASRDADDAGEDEGDEDEADEDGHDDAESGADEDDDGEDGAPAAGTLAATAGARPSRAARDAGSVRRSDKFVVDPKSTYMPPHVVARGAPPPADDCMLLCAGLFGFVLLFAFGAVMPFFGVPHDLLMAGAMAALMLLVVLLNFCPRNCCSSCGCDRAGREHLSPVDSLSPFLVFIVAGCFGCLLGGVLGGASRYTAWPKIF